MLLCTCYLDYLTLFLSSGLCTGLPNDVCVWSGAVAFLCASGDKECCGCQVATDWWILRLYSDDPVEHI